MLRQAFRLRQRSILQQVTRSTQNISPLRISQTRTFQTTTRSLDDESYTTPSPHSSSSLDDKVNNIRSEIATTKSEMKLEMAATKSEVAATKSEMTHLTEKINQIAGEMKSLNNNLTTQMKSLTETVTAQLSVFNANMESKISVLSASMDSRMDKFENRFLFRMFFTVFGVVIIGVSGALVRYQTPAIQTPAVQIPATQAPAIGQN